MTSRRDIIPRDVQVTVDRLRTMGRGRPLPPPVWYAGTINESADEALRVRRNYIKTLILTPGLSGFDWF